MGNCAASQHGGESWADGDEWEEEASASSEEDHHERREHLSEVTIRITKRQLHELIEMGRKGAGGRGKSRQSAQQLLADIMNSGEVHHHDQHREPHWKPALESIPESVDS